MDKCSVMKSSSDGKAYFREAPLSTSKAHQTRSFVKKHLGHFKLNKNFFLVFVLNDHLEQIQIQKENVQFEIVIQNNLSVS